MDDRIAELDALFRGWLEIGTDTRLETVIEAWRTWLREAALNSRRYETLLDVAHRTCERHKWLKEATLKELAETVAAMQTNPEARQGSESPVANPISPRHDDARLPAVAKGPHAALLDRARQYLNGEWTMDIKQERSYARSLLSELVSAMQPLAPHE